MLTKGPPAALGLRLFTGLGRDQLVDLRSLAGSRSQQAPNALHVFALTRATADDDGDVGVGNV